MIDLEDDVQRGWDPLRIKVARLRPAGIEADHFDDQDRVGTEFIEPAGAAFFRGRAV